MKWDGLGRWALILVFGLLTPPAVAQEAAEEAEGQKKEEKWDVSNPPGEWSEIEIDTDEGTWLSLDLSPDGSEIVFDLLGDIYSIPITGGDAKPLTSGIAWDMQPRFSPDGLRIAFTSDRAGGDNVWIMNRDGSNPRQVSKESFRLLNSPAWSPDGYSIAARKHFTSARSLGAGEIWLYHVSGGSGLQVVKRPNDQKDLGEPVFSADGRSILYSLDATSGPVFEYNKDSNGSIYQIREVDLESGETRTVTGGPGGAIRPTPSPDGKRLAFVRRVRAKSVLYIRDLKSGAEWPVYDGLDRDMQETWAIHGVYPSMAWTPDNRELVFWAGGKIHRLDVESRAIRNIPFRVRDRRKAAPAVRFPVEVSPGEFPVKMLRWVQVSPLGDQVVYQALGHLYVRSLPDGAPRRLTSQNEHFEYYPSFSRDGRNIVYVSWTDRELGAVHVVPSSGGEGRRITDEPGHYVEPVFSPDGKVIVFRKARGSQLTNPLWSSDPGLYWVSSEGGPVHMVTRSGSQPQFAEGSDRVFFVTGGGEKTLLKSIELDGSDEREHFNSRWATQFQLSPDGKWVAFVERFNAYIAGFPRTGSSIELGPKVDSLPVKKVTRDAGEYLHWSGDSSTLHWSLGPELFSLDLKDAFGFLPDAPETLPELPVQGRNISFTATTDVPSGKIALVGARLITMRGDEVIENGTVVVDRNRIVAVGPRSQVDVPSDALVVDVAGQTIMPGIVDVHAHGGQGANEIIPQQNPEHFAGLAFGVTTTHDPSNDTSTIFAASEMAKAGQLTAPRIYSTGTILYGATTAFTAEVNNLEEARSHLRRMKAVGAFSVKSYNQPRRDQRQQVLQAARELEMMVVPEGGSLYQHNMSMVVDGHTGIEHSIPVARIYKDAIQLWGGTEVGYTPTLVVAYGGLTGEYYWYEHTNVWENERLLSFIPREEIDARSRRRQMTPLEEYNHIDIARGAYALTQAGVKVNIGAHGQREGLGAHWEIWMLGQGGATPIEAIRSATLNGAHYLGLDRDLGSLEVGKLADLVVLEKNPLENLRDTEAIRYTMVNGRLYDARTMDQVGNHPQKRAPLGWELARQPQK